MYPIFDVSGSVTDRPETLGSKAKMWLTPDPLLGLPAEQHLFKVGRPGTGENWAEKAACEIAKALELPCAEYDLAVLDGTQGVLSQRFVPLGVPFIPGNMIFSRVDKNYDGSLRFKQVRYKLQAAMKILQANWLLPLNAAARDTALKAQEFFAGYLIFDALIGNTDRHHENWGVAVVRNDTKVDFHLAPTFDHASSLGRELTDERRHDRLNTRDQGYSVEAYAERARSAFYGMWKREEDPDEQRGCPDAEGAAPQRNEYLVSAHRRLGTGRLGKDFCQHPA
jgi:hypothetical protein